VPPKNNPGNAAPHLGTHDAYKRYARETPPDDLVSSVFPTLAQVHHVAASRFFVSSEESYLSRIPACLHLRPSFPSAFPRTSPALYGDVSEFAVCPASWRERSPTNPSASSWVVSLANSKPIMAPSRNRRLPQQDERDRSADPRCRGGARTGAHVETWRTWRSTTRRRTTTNTRLRHLAFGTYRVPHRAPPGRHSRARAVSPWRCWIHVSRSP